MSPSKVHNFTKGTGPEVLPGYSRGDSWNASTGPHTGCKPKIHVLGAGVGAGADGTPHEGVLVRCGGCLLSWVLM